MTQIALHFEIGPQIEAESAARSLAVECLTISGVEGAKGEAVATRGVSEVVVVLTLTTAALTAAGSTLTALKSVIVAVKELAATLGLQRVKVEDGLKLVLPDQLTESDAKRITSSKGAASIPPRTKDHKNSKS